MAMSQEELYQYLLNNNIDPEIAWQFVSSGKSEKNFGELGLGKGILSRFASGLMDKDKPLIGGNFKLPDIGKAASTIRNKPLYEGGPSIAKSANTLSGLYQGGKALKGLYENSLTQADLDSLKQDIRLQTVSNPMYSMYMDAADEKLLRQMNNDTSTTNINSAVEGGVKGLPKAAISAILGGLTGGIGGAAIGGLGSLLNSGIEGYGQGMQKQQSQLQGLYDRLKMADEEYRSMKRPAGIRSAGLQTRYFNQLY